MRSLADRGSARVAVICCALIAAGLATPGRAQTPVRIRVDAADRQGRLEPIWRFFGYDEPNYAYMPNGRKLLAQLASAMPVSVYVRTHNLLTSGDGRPRLKWGSTNVYTEDAAGNPVYDWTIVDRIFDQYVELGMRPLVEIGFMPQALTSGPEPYEHHWAPDDPNRSIVAGWAYPPRDYEKWAQLVYEWVRHCVERYGADEVREWYWEPWNEPNISYWQGTDEEYFKLYDYTVDAVRRAAPEARVGGPHSTGPGREQAAAFLRAFLEHVVRGTNYATGRTGSPIDYIGFHAKGRPEVVDGRVRMGSRFQLQDIDRGFEIVASFPELRELPIIIGESDPEGCAACPERYFPHNAYRNGTMYSSYTAATFPRKLELAARRGVQLRGAVTWAFEFEDQPLFAGFRSLATGGIAKPVLNVFRMFGMLAPERVAVRSSGAARLEDMLESGVVGEPDIDALASRGEHSLTVLVWNYHDDDLPAPAAPVELRIGGLPSEPVLVEHFRVDDEHSNSYSAWKRMGSPRQPTLEQRRLLEQASELALAESPLWRRPAGGAVEMRFDLPRQAVSLIRISWGDRATAR